MVYLSLYCPLSKSNLENSASILTTPCSIQIQHSHFRGRHYQVKKLRPKIRTLRLKPFEEKSQKLHEGANKLTLSWEALKAAKHFAFWWVHLTFDAFAVLTRFVPFKNRVTSYQSSNICRPLMSGNTLWLTLSPVPLQPRGWIWPPSLHFRQHVSRSHQHPRQQRYESRVSPHLSLE